MATGGRWYDEPATAETALPQKTPGRSGPPAAQLVADRYTLLRELSRGGMGVVFHARDEVSGRELALKRSFPGGRGEGFAPLFQREYRTLASIQHPRIIRVFDYGIDDGVPFYTMELLDGHDLVELVPIPWRLTCAYLRDVATSLLLLHQRRLVHRDLSPRNVRLTSDGHCKLLDFGALSPFGVPSEIAGTVPLMPPELVRGQSLDQRADLFSLGGLAYFMLAGKHAFRVKEIAELEEAWKTSPVPPSLLLRSAAAKLEEMTRVPPRLDELVLELLGVDPMARPASAAEVIDRLTSVAELADDGDALSAEHYLATHLVGREPALARLQAALEGREHREGSGVVIEGATGTGVSRLLREFTIRAQITGATVLSIGGATCQGSYSAVRTLVRTAFEAAERDARASLGDHGPIFLRAFPELSKHLPEDMRPAAPFGNPGIFRAQIQAAVTQWWLRLGARRRVVIVVDDLQAVDEPSAAALVALAIDGASSDVLVVFGRRTTDPFVAEAALRALTATTEPVSLDNLDADGMHELMRALLGDVRHAERFTNWVHGLTGGNPGRTIELVRHLVASGVIAHHEGVWSVPQELGSVELPSSLDNLQSERLLELGVLALRLAELMSLHDGPISAELCGALLGSEPREAVLSALAELVSANVLRVTGSTYYFAQELLRIAVRARLSIPEQRLLHGGIAECLLASKTADTQSRMAAGFHLVRAGDERRGADLLRETALDFVDRYDDMIAAAPALEEALRIYRSDNRKPHELLELLMPLCFAGYYVDRRLADRHARDTVLMAEALVGLSLARRLRPLLGKRFSTVLGLAWGALGFVLSRERGGIDGFMSLMRTLTMCIVFLCAKSTICLEAEETEWLAERLEPLTALGPRSAATLSYRYAMALTHVTRGHPARVVREMKAVLVDLDAPEKISNFPMEAHTSLVGGALYAIGAMQSFLDEPDALATADALERLGHRIYDLAADQLRANYYACQGDLENAALFRRKLEAHALTSGSVWQADVWAPSSQILADIATDDIIGTKRTWNELSRLSREVPSLRRYEIGARLVYLIQTGRAGEALAEFPPMFEGSPPNGFVGWSTSMGSLACVYNALGRHEEARKVCEDALALLEAGDLDYVALNLRVELQLTRALAGLGHVEEAVARLEALATRHGPNGGRVAMGMIHTALADMAIASGDTPAFERHASTVEAFYHPSKNPALVAQASRLRLRARFAGLTSDGPSPDAPGPRVTAWARALESCKDARARAAVSLALVVENTGALRGFLFANDEGKPRLLASSSEVRPSVDVVDGAANEIVRYEDERTDVMKTMLTELHATTIVTAGSQEALAPPLLFQPVVRPEGGKLCVVAVCALERGNGPLLPADWDLMQLVASYL
jgi:tetratricopeptide (TPR) repeat protein